MNLKYINKLKTNQQNNIIQLKNMQKNQKNIKRRATTLKPLGA
jgi:hypothetical protein